MRLSTLLYSRVNCGFRSVVDILKIVNHTFDGVLGEIPSHNTIENWIKKCGLDIYNSPAKPLLSSEYAMVVDESMMVGSQKLLLTVGIPGGHTGTPLAREDVSILDMAVSSSWSGNGVKERLLASAAKIGHSPQYVISDNAYIMKNGINYASFSAHGDISHSLGMLLERCYKQEMDFIAYTKSMSQAQCKHNMNKTAYLLPPRQRTIARFINLANWVKWSNKILQVYYNLKAEEKEVLSFVPSNASLIDELSEVMECINYIEKACKHNGLSTQTIKKCLGKIRTTLFKGNARQNKLGQSIYLLLLKEMEMFENQTIVHNNSSDIIESIFGVYKQRKSPNKLFGVTSFILFIPAYTQLAQERYLKSNSVKEHVENIKLRQIKQWSRRNLMENMVTKRINALKITA